VLYEISKKSGITIYFVNEDLSMYKDITYEAKNQEVKNILEDLLKGKDLQFEIISEKQIGIRKIKPKAISSEEFRDSLVTVTGQVLDPKGKPIPGATIKIEAGNKGTTADVNGFFSLKNVSAKANLTISSVQYVSRQIRVQGGSSLGKIVLEEYVGTLDETIIIGYGEVSTRNSTGNVTKITADVIARQPVSNPLYALQGRVAGLIVTPSGGLPGKEVNLQIRGRNTLRSDIAGADPLIIVDGLPYNNTIPRISGYDLIGNMSALSFINPNDIESISVLKDADATSIYGSRGSNGVILITTKKGKDGATKLNVNLRSGITQVPQRLKLMNTDQYLSMRREGLTNDGRINRLQDPGFAGVYPDLMLWDQKQYTDWQEEILGGSGSYADAQVSISGGAPLVQYLIGGNFHRESSVFPLQNSDKNGGAHMSITGYSNDRRLKMTLTSSYMVSSTRLPGMDLTEYIFREPNTPSIYHTDGTINWALYPATGDGTTLQYDPYPVYNLRKFESSVQNFINGLDLSYNIGDFRFKINAGFGDLRGSSFKSIPGASVDPSRLINEEDRARSTQYYTNRVKNLSIEPQVNYGVNISQGKLDLLVGASYQSNSILNTYLGLYGYSNDRLLRSQDAAAFVDMKSNSSSMYKYNAAFARIGYNWKQKYIINLNARRDGSSRFGPGSQFGNFGSVGVAYNFTEEDWFKQKLTWLTFGKIRASYGTSGNDGIGDYNYLELYAPAGAFPYQDIKGYMSSGLFNPYYRWETTKKLEAGIELNIANDKLFVNASFYRNRSDNQLINYPIPYFAGYGSFKSNTPALIQNHGIELQLNSTIVSSKNISWNAALNFTINRNKLIKYLDINSSFAEISRTLEGQPFFGYVDVYKSTGVDSTGIYVFDRKGEDVQNPETGDAPKFGKDTRIITYPKFFGGLSNQVRIGQVTLDFFLQFTKQIGINPYVQTLAYPGARYNQLSYIYGKQWQNKGDDAEFQKFSTTGKSVNYQYYKESDRGYTNASFVRLKNVSISYDLPKALRKRLKLNACRIYLQGQNLLTFTPYEGLDPETQSLTTLPPLRVITAGFQIEL
jgi:TonB-linked SusC/RagA family outer membrane protein